MALHNAQILAQIRMIRRFLLLVFLLSARATAQEPDVPVRVPMPTMGGKQFWADELFFHQWRIQRNVLDDHCRLLDPENMRYAWGSYEECRAALERIKRRENLPRMSGKAVIVLHGLVRSRSSMESLCKYLHEQGGYEVFNVGYPSTREDIAEHARSLRHIIQNLDGIEEINFVAHSMGNIVVRHYLGDLARQEPWKQPANSLAADRRASVRFHRFVMLGPPNQGAQLAEMFSDNVVFKEIMGESGLELGRDWPELEKRLATPPMQFGIIAGGKGNDKGYNPMLSGDNDSTISVDTTKLAGASDFVVVPVLHSLMMDNDNVQEYVLRFLKDGYFISKQQQHPLKNSL
jgi:triacylglycerol esterase/lipase EstA (alpha/beta hydrolase family)